MIEEITSDQKCQIKGFAGLAIEAVLDELGLSKKAAERIVKNGAPCQELLKEHFRSVLTQLAIPKRFGNEEVKSRFGYFSGYRKPRPITEQVNRLCGFLE